MGNATPVDRGVETGASALGACTTCGHTPQGRRVGWFSKQVHCATHSYTDIGDADDCWCRDQVHASEILASIYDSPCVDDIRLHT